MKNFNYNDMVNIWIKKTLIIVLLIIVVCSMISLIYVVSLDNNVKNNTAITNTTNLRNITSGNVVASESMSNGESKGYSSQSQDPHSDLVCEGDTEYSKQMIDGNYALYDKSSGRMIGTGDMPDRHGYHDQEYVDKYSSTVKYRSDGKYYEG